MSAFIDCENGGVRDGYQDITLCVSELMIDCPGTISGFYEAMGIVKSDEKKLRYYMLLDEMF